MFTREQLRQHSRYAYYPCSRCGQVVAHTKGGRVLHMHARSEKCDRESKRFVRGRFRETVFASGKA